jgi:putative ABC transport system substrate-binding protein
MKRASLPLQRRAFIAALGSAAAWPLVARGQQRSMTTVGYLSSATSAGFAQFVAAFREGLSETGYVEDRNITLLFRWAEGQNDRLPAW